jgi:carboxypeptidase D
MGFKTLVLAALGLVALSNASAIDTRANKPANTQYYNSKTSRKLITLNSIPTLHADSYLIEYYVSPKGIPEVSFDVGESYAGQIPVDLKKNGSKDPKFFYWFFPTVNPAGKDDVVIWFNGGPGCSSLEGTSIRFNLTWQY